MSLPTKAFTLADMLLIHGNSTPGRIQSRLMFVDSYEEQVSIVNDAIDYCIKDLVVSKHHRKDDGEDRLTVDIVSILKAMGFQASHDTDVGGHCDVVIVGKNDFLWLGEAKIHKSYDWDFQGLQQLSTRYSTGLVGQDHGGLILYTWNKNSKEMMDKWAAHLVASKPDLTIETCSRNPLVRNSVHDHPATGLPFYVRHTPVSLYFSPQDK